MSTALEIKSGTVTAIVPATLTAREMAAKAAVEHFKSFEGIVDCEELKVIVDQELAKVMQQKRELNQEMGALTDPLVKIRSNALTVKRGIENKYAGYTSYLDTGERILKGELIRYNAVQQQARARAEADARRRAEEEAEAQRKQLRDEADRQAAAAAERARIEQEAAAKLREEAEKAKGKKAKELLAQAAEVEQQSALALDAAAEEISATLDEAEQVEVAEVSIADESIKVKGTSISTRWVAEVENVLEVLAGIVALETPIDALRVVVAGKRVPASSYIPGSLSRSTAPLSEIEGIEINMPWFNEKASNQKGQFQFRGMIAKEVTGLTKRV